MTLKDIIAIASNDEAMDLLKEIESIQRNMCHKTIYEQKTANRRIKEYANEIKTLIIAE